MRLLLRATSRTSTSEFVRHGGDEGERHAQGVRGCASPALRDEMPEKGSLVSFRVLLV